MLAKCKVSPVKGDNCKSTYLNLRPKGNKNIGHNRIVLAKFFREIIASME